MPLRWGDVTTLLLAGLLSLATEGARAADGADAAGTTDATGAGAADANAATDVAAAQAETAAEDEAPPSDDLARLANMSLEDLMKTRVVSVTGTPGTRIGTPAAVTVITAEDVRRNGFRSVVEALRLVPNMFVGRINSSSWIAGARGLTGSPLTANRYLVLIDGRLVYDPLISVTFWDVIDVPLADLDRIEVIRGPGATLWGVNAMNGVVNIITKPAADTTGTLVQAGAGSNAEASGTLRYGAQRDEDTAFRTWLKFDTHGDFEDAAGNSLHDEWSSLHGGFRLDGALTGSVRYTLQGDAYTHPRAMESVRLPVPGEDNQFVQHTQDDDVDGANVLFRLLKGFGEDDGWLLRTYIDHTHRDTSRFGVRRETFNVEYRRWLALGERNKAIWGVQADRTRDHVDNGPVLLLDPATRGWTTLNAFVQDTAELVDDRVFLMLGTKLTRHDFVGFQTQPSARLWWTPSERQTWWAAVSRPVRVPSRFEEDGLLVFSYVDQGRITTGQPNGVIVPLGLSGDDTLRPEKLLSWEVGHRLQASDRWSFDTTLFYNDYQRLIGVPIGIFGSFSDEGSGATWGGSFSVSARLTDRWRMDGSYSRLRTRIDGPILPFDETSTPGEQWQLHSYFDVTDAFELNAALYHVARIPFLGVEAYDRADVGVTWRPREGLAFSLWGRNLLDAAHAETSGAQVPRVVYAQVSFGLGH